MEAEVAKAVRVVKVVGVVVPVLGCTCITMVQELILMIARFLSEPQGWVVRVHPEGLEEQEVREE